MLNESRTDRVECCREMLSGRNFAGVISSLANAMGFRLEKKALSGPSNNRNKEQGFVKVNVLCLVQVMNP